MNKRHTEAELLEICDNLTKEKGDRVYKHIESGKLYIAGKVAWSTDLQKPVIMYCPYDNHSLVFTRDHEVFDGIKFHAISEASQ